MTTVVLLDGTVLTGAAALKRLAEDAPMPRPRRPKGPRPTVGWLDRHPEPIELRP